MHHTEALPHSREEASRQREPAAGRADVSPSVDNVMGAAAGKQAEQGPGADEGQVSFSIGFRADGQYLL